MTTPTDPLQAARAALSKASAADHRIRRADPLVLAQWAEILGDTTPFEAMAAVKAFYGRPQKQPIMPGDVRAHVLAARVDTTQRRYSRDVVSDVRRIRDHPGNPDTIAAARADIDTLLTETIPARKRERANPSHQGDPTP